jgi:hypothetical protein
MFKQAKYNRYVSYRRRKKHVQNKSPCPATPSPAVAGPCNIVHSHAGYSSSGNATGSCLFFSKFKPLSGVPAGILLLTRGVTFFFAASLAWALRSPEGAGVSGALKGCAAEVDVAAGGACEDVDAFWRGTGCEAEEMGVAFVRRDVVVRKR